MSEAWKFNVYLLSAGAGVLILAIGSMAGAAGLTALILLFLVSVFLGRTLIRRYRPRHMESSLKNDAPQKTPVSIAADRGPEITSKSPALTAKPSLLEAIGREVIATRDLELIGNQALDYLRRYTRAETVLFLVRRADRLEVLSAAGPNGPRLLGTGYELEGSLAAVLGDDGMTLNMPNLSVDVALGFKDGLTGKLADLGVMSLLLAAVGTTGLLALVGSGMDVFTKFDEAAVESVAFQLRYIAENIQETDVLRRSVDDLDSLLSAINKVSSGEDLSDTLRLTLNSAVELCGAGSGSFFLFDEKSERLTLEVSVGLPESATAVEIGLGEGIAGWVAVHRKPVVIKDLDGKTASQAGLGPVKTAAAISLPVEAGERLVGVLNLGSARADHDFKAGGLTQAVRLLGQIGAAISVRQTNAEWQSLYFDTIKALARVIESRDPFGAGHAENVSTYAGALARELRLSEDEISTVELAGLLHDIGATGISDSVFRQERPLNSVERLLIRNHPRLGAKALSEITRLKGMLPIIQHHHENFDGTGYADGLKGEEIPLGARVMAVAEAFAAMTTDRPYRPAKPEAEALDELRRGAGKQFDPQIVYVFGKLMEKELKP